MPPSKSKLTQFFRKKCIDKSEFSLKGKVLMPSRPNHSPLFLADSQKGSHSQSFIDSQKQEGTSADGHVLGLHEEGKR